jgi:hypothetical protein
LALTFGQARKLLAKYAGPAGVCPDSEEVGLFVLQVLQHLLISGAHGNVRKFVFNAVRGQITLPYELETPLKIKIGDAVASVWSHWFDFYHTGHEHGCREAFEALTEEPDYYSTVYDLHPPFSRVGVLGIVDEDKDSHIVVSGYDQTGREVVTQHQGKEIIGEYLQIIRGKVQVSNVNFSSIKTIQKSRTKGYATLYGIDPQTGAKKFLSDYAPFEEIPRYRRFRLTSKCPDSVKVTVLGRIRLKEYYADNDILPFENHYALVLAAQGMQSNENNDIQTATAKDAMMTNVVSRENSSKQINNGTTVEMYKPLSMGSLKTLL